MIKIESYILKPNQVRGGENILNPITNWGGHNASITVNGDGSGELKYNNSDYTHSLTGVLVKGLESTFTLANVTSNDTVELYEDGTLVQTRTGNTFKYTPTTPGEHEYYFRINGTPTTSFTETVYTVANVIWDSPSYTGNPTEAYIQHTQSFTVTGTVVTNEGVMSGVPVVLQKFGTTNYTHYYTNEKGGFTITLSPETLDAWRQNQDYAGVMVWTGGADTSSDRTRYWQVYNYIHWFISSANYNLPLNNSPDVTINTNNVSLNANKYWFFDTGILTGNKIELKASCTNPIYGLGTDGSFSRLDYDGKIHLKNPNSDNTIYAYDTTGTLRTSFTANNNYIILKAGTSTVQLSDIRLKTIP